MCAKWQCIADQLLVITILWTLYCTLKSRIASYIVSAFIVDTFNGEADLAALATFLCGSFIIGLVYWQHRLLHCWHHRNSMTNRFRPSSESL